MPEGRGCGWAALRLFLLAASLAPCAARRWGEPARCAVLCHGFHVDAVDWHAVVIGDEGALGRATYAALLAHDERAALLVFGSGGSRRGDEAEGEYTLRVLRESVDSVPAGQRAAVAQLLASATTETVSRNTAEELERLVPLIAEHGIDKVILVSSPAHCPRVVREAHRILRPHFPDLVIYAAPCQTSFACCDDVAILEPPHRGDRNAALDPAPPLHALAGRMLHLRPHQKPDFARRADALLLELETADS
ncbi:hypothetical protein M885DRAFT_517156 [Pelagophyceae sp. CCMP2097]|nr:hypothetical protein M885DRAFT_517156 [Pelagophyceae sp. CCMP2097]|mmetsp:Transcript_1681/g.6152  ORF Transcript_1681/g.6152 Transcript_1681/m.6152 type:complete len:250 (+) Transcript_1681:137-886(+)